ncbi:MAG: radical SAM protein [Desulfobacteraceae bacterium]|nr:radical SAM protein [Desulfobacteraceae bacterium]
MKKTLFHKMRSAHLPFGDWYYFPRKSLNIVKLAHSPNALWKPVHISIALTSQCEKNCDFCYADSAREGETLWKFENVVKMVESCDRNGVFAVTLGGGEPILWNDRSAKADFYDLLNELSSFGCDVSFTTSALPTVDWTRIPHTILPRVSLHHHQEIDFICNEIKTAGECRGSIPAVNLLVRKGEIADLLTAAEKLAETGVNDFLLIPLRPAGRAFGFGSSLIPTENELQQLVRLFPVPNVKLSSCCHLENHKDTFLGCGAGDWFVSIDEKHCIKSCSFSETGISLSDFDYQEILDVLPFLNRLECHSRIRL